MSKEKNKFLDIMENHVISFLVSIELGYLEKEGVLAKALNKRKRYNYSTEKIHSTYTNLTEHQQLVDKVKQELISSELITYKLAEDGDYVRNDIYRTPLIMDCPEAYEHVIVLNTVSKDRIKEIQLKMYKHKTYGAFITVVHGEVAKENYAQLISVHPVDKTSERLVLSLHEILYRYYKEDMHSTDLEGVYLHKGKASDYEYDAGIHPRHIVGFTCQVEESEPDTLEELAEFKDIPVSALPYKTSEVLYGDKQPTTKASENTKRLCMELKDLSRRLNIGE